MRRWARIAYVASLILFLGGLAFQVYLVGQALFVDQRDWADHMGAGWLVAHGLPLPILVTALLSRLDRRRWVVLAALLVSAAAQPFLAASRESSPSIAVLHPLNAMLLVGLTVWLIVDGWRLVREPPASGQASPR